VGESVRREGSVRVSTTGFMQDRLRVRECGARAAHDDGYDFCLCFRANGGFLCRVRMSYGVCP
jgi:hypothetical protein